MCICFLLVQHVLTITFASMVNVLIINKSKNPLPAYATTGSSGMDLRANLESPIELQPMQRMLVPTGLFLSLPANHEAQVRPRSGLSIKQGITCVNAVGTIDEDYRGELQVPLINLSSETQTINHGDRIAQMIIAKVEKANLVLVNQLEESERGIGGFGSTGVQ
jgi:dUTP pyrophosphatase